MIRRLVAKEILTNLLSLRLTFTFLILVPLVVVSVYILCNDYQQRKEDYDSKVSLHMRTAASERIRINRPPFPLMALVSGVTTTTANTVDMLYYTTPRVKGGFDHTPIYYTFLRTDYLFIIGIVMSLITLVFSYDAISGEREGGTLRLVLSNSVPRDVVLFSKWLGGYLSAAFSCMTALLAGVLVFYLHPAISLTPTDWWVIISLLAAAFIYLAIFLSLGVFISAISPTTGHAAMRCLFVWLLFVLVIPNAAPHIARRFVAIPSAQEMERQYDRIVADTARNRHDDHVAASKYLSNTNPVSQEEFTRILLRIQRKITEIDESHLSRQRDSIRQLVNTYNGELRKQMQLGKFLAWCSPYAVFTDIATTLANTGGESQMNFLKAAWQYEEDYFRERYREALEKGWNIRRHHHVPNPPEFHPTTPDLQKRLKQCLPGVGTLVFFGLIFFMAGYLLFLRRPL